MDRHTDGRSDRQTDLYEWIERDFDERIDRWIDKCLNRETCQRRRRPFKLKNPRCPHPASDFEVRLRLQSFIWLSSAKTQSAFLRRHFANVNAALGRVANTKKVF
jgi:hypothetical protein